VIFRPWIPFILVVLSLACPPISLGSLRDLCDPQLVAAVESDWIRQEEAHGRRPDDVELLREVYRRGGLLMAHLQSSPHRIDFSSEAGLYLQLGGQIENIETLDEQQRLSFYKELRWLNRAVALKNPMLGDQPIVFLKRRRFVCQMLHEYLGYYYDFEEIEGGGVFLLKDPGHSLEIHELAGHQLPKGNYTTLSLSYDAKTIFFAFAERSASKPDYYSSERNGFHIYAMDSDGNNLRQLTSGLFDDFDPCELPDGGIVFMSTRRGGFGRCHNPWEPLPTYTLHRMEPDGGNINTLSFHETNEWHPSVLNDGRIIYTRWDYVDRSAAHFHGLWVSNPDGSNPDVIFGNYTQKINACFQGRAIPGSNRVVFVAGAHHADVGGALVLCNPDQVRLNRESGEDEFSAIEELTPEICFPEAEGWPKTFYHSPWPLSEEFFLVSYSFEPLSGMGSGVKQDGYTGIYLLDRFGNMELLYRNASISSMYPIPLRPRDVPPVISSNLDHAMGSEGEFMLSDVNTALMGMPADRTIRELRVFQVLPKTETHIANNPQLGYANAESARMLLGTVPVEEDGSAYFRAPAKKPLLFQAVDGDGRVVMGMRSLTYLQPGERRGCVGCHEGVHDIADYIPPVAFHREPSRIEPGPSGSMPWNYALLVQPVLDQRCVSCHHGNPEGAQPGLTGEPQGDFTVSYQNLRPYVHWFEWGGDEVDAIVTQPGRMPSDISPLVGILEDEHHYGKMDLREEERRRLYLWLDGNASFFGVYARDALLAQLHGQAIEPPSVQ
jgi:hypothetical protein